MTDTSREAIEQLLATLKDGLRAAYVVMDTLQAERTAREQAEARYTDLCRILEAAFYDPDPVDWEPVGDYRNVDWQGVITSVVTRIHAADARVRELEAQAQDVQDRLHRVECHGGTGEQINAGEGNGHAGVFA